MCLSRTIAVLKERFLARFEGYQICGTLGSTLINQIIIQKLANLRCKMLAELLQCAIRQANSDWIFMQFLLPIRALSRPIVVLKERFGASRVVEFAEH